MLLNASPQAPHGGGGSAGSAIFFFRERMTVRMELAAALHHSSFRGAGPVTYDAPRRQRTANSRVDSVLFDLFAEDTEGARPDRIATLSGPHARVQRRTVQQIVDEVSPVPLLDDPVPQMVEQLPDVLRFFDRFATVPEQVIAVPKIFIESVPTRAFLRATQLAEQLVEVPTIISFSLGSLLKSLLEYKQRTVEQNVDIPAVGGIGTGGGSSGFLPGQSTSETGEQIVEIPVPRPDGAGDLQGFHRGQVSTAFTEQIAEFPDPGGGQDFQPVQGSAASSSDLPGQPGQGVFRTFPQHKKVRLILRTRGRNCLRTRAHGRQRLMTRPWCLRRRRKRRRRSARRTLQWSTSSTTIAYGSASGTQLASGIAGGWPLPMGHRLVMPSGGRRGSSGVDQGDLLGTTVVTWSASVLELMPYFFFSTRRRTRILRSSVFSLACLRITLNGEVWTVCPQRLPCFRTWNLDNML